MSHCSSVTVLWYATFTHPSISQHLPLDAFAGLRWGRGLEPGANPRQVTSPPLDSIRNKQPFYTHIHVWGQWKVPYPLKACCQTVGGSQRPLRGPTSHAENMHIPHRKTSGLQWIETQDLGDSANHCHEIGAEIWLFFFFRPIKLTVANKSVTSVRQKRGRGQSVCG